MSYMNEEYKSRFGMNRANMHMDGTTWSSRNRAVSWGSRNRDDMTWGSRNRDDMTWGSRNRDDVSLGSRNRDDMTLGSRNRDDVSRGNMSRDVTWSGVKKDPLSWGSMNRDVSQGNMRQDHMNRDDMTWGNMNRDVAWSGMKKDPLSWGNMNRGDFSQGNMNKDYMTWGSVDRDDRIRGSVDRDDRIQGSVDRDDRIQGSVDRDDRIQGSVDRDDRIQGSTDGDAAAQGSMDGDAAEQSSTDEDAAEQGSTHGDAAKQGDTSHPEINEGDVTQGEMDDVTCSDPNEDNTVESDKPEDDEKKLFCEVCRLTCPNYASYRSHIRGAKHAKQITSSERTNFHWLFKYQKYNRTGKTLKDYMDEPVREPLIGLEHVIEYILPGRLDPNYSCSLCDCKMELAPMIAHVNGFKHRRAYISKEFPFLLKAPPAAPGQKHNKMQFLKKMAADIERDDGLKMYKRGFITKKKKVKCLPELKPDETTNKETRGTLVTDKETLKMNALQFMDAFEIDSDSEALLVMTIAQALTENLKTYCSKVKQETEQAEKVAIVKSVAEALSHAKPPQQTALQDSVSADQYPSGSGNWKPEPICENQPAQCAPGGPNWNQETMQNQSVLGHGNWDREAVRTIPLLQKAQYGAGRDDWSLDPMMQVRQALNCENAQSIPAQSSASLGSLSDPLGPKGNSELRPFPPSEPRGPRGFPSGNRCFGNEYSRFDRGPLPGSMVGGPSALLAQANHLQRSNPSAPGLGRMLDVPGGKNLPAGYMRALQDQGTRFQPAGTPANFSAGPRRMPANLDIQERIDNVSFSKFLPRNAHLTADRMPIGPSAAMGLPRALAPKTTEKNASPLTTEIVNRIRGKDVKSASVILTSLAATNPALQKVNIANLLNLLVQIGTIK